MTKENMMEITKVKHWSKMVQNETVDHVKISYSDGDKILDLHQVGMRATAAPEFYAAFENMTPVICAACGFKKQFETAIKLREISITRKEDKDGNDTTSYKMECSVKAGHANVSMTVTNQHKFVPEGFDGVVADLINEAEEYVGGKRMQTDAFESAEEEEQAENTPENEDLLDEEVQEGEEL